MSALPWLTVLHGDCREVLPTLDAGSVNCVVTSPPYFGLRDYGTASWEGGDLACDHVERALRPSAKSTLQDHGDDGRSPQLDALPGIPFKDRCGKCGAVRQDSQIGLEQTPADYVAALVDVFREVRRVLRDDGTVWLNLGDGYAANRSYQVTDNKHIDVGNTRASAVPPGLKPKDLIGTPWRVAFALQADGWYLRSAITLCKRNPMPESVTDRPTSATEMMFLLTKRASYWYDADAVREPASEYDRKGGTAPWTAESGHSNGIGSSTFHQMSAAGRNLRNWWEVSSEPYPGAHFATFGQKWITPCILAGCPDKVCAECGAPWERVVERVGGVRYATGKSAEKNRAGLATAFSGYTDGSSAPTFITTGWQPTCAHHDAETVPGVVLDPFAGTGTALLVANKLSRRAIGIDLSGEYLEQLATRNQQTPLGLVG